MGEDFGQLAVASGAAGGTFGLTFVAVRWCANFIAGRLDRKEDRIDADMASLIEGLKERVDALTKSERELRAELSANREEFRTYQRETDEQLRDCRRKHSESEAEVMQLRAMLQGYGDARQLAQVNASADKLETGDRQ